MMWSVAASTETAGKRKWKSIMKEIVNRRIQSIYLLETLQATIVLRR